MSHHSNPASLFPRAIVTITATPEMWETPVLEKEEALIAGSVHKRRREFRAGRHCAHQALKCLGLEVTPLLRGERREPIWPQGYLGSISHCDGYALAACALQGDIVGIGIDVEPLSPLKRDVEQLIHTERERRFMQANPEIPERLIFSAKESLYKCYYPLVKQFFDFQEVELAIDLTTRCFSFSSQPEAGISFPAYAKFHGSFLNTGSHLITGCYLTR
ncbi:MAG: 4'-phosphopantetheinyl transferase superfamily protein [Gammaproteobacteria bacterium (ex Lamellibrachia satsuma)]|nr:MAG: 4'-phosphopantetheinyl transferase superfamily protein [Gammaproteobacteria bacterium (ex Lamellibrachia satsuma)]